MKKILILTMCMFASVAVSHSTHDSLIHQNIANHIQTFHAICYTNKNNLEDMGKMAGIVGWKQINAKETHMWGLPDHYIGIENKFRHYSLMVKEGPEINMCNIRQEIRYSKTEDRALFVKLLQNQYPLQKDTQMIDTQTANRLLHGETHSMIAARDDVESYSWFNNDGYLIGVHFFDGTMSDKNYYNVRIELTRL